MKSSTVILFMVGILLAMGYLTHRFDNNDLVEQEIKSRVVKIESYDKISDVKAGEGGQGTGTLIGNNKILTNAHLFPDKVQGTVQIHFRRYDEDHYTDAVVVSSDPYKDLAVLSFKGIDQTLPLRTTTHWKLGEPLILLGNPRAGDFVLGHSKIKALSLAKRGDDYVRDTIVFDCNEGGPGFSGSGVYNNQGEYLGVFELGEYEPSLLELILYRVAGVQRSNFCYAIPSDEIKGEIK